MLFILIYFNAFILLVPRSAPSERKRQKPKRKIEKKIIKRTTNNTSYLLGISFLVEESDDFIWCFFHLRTRAIMLTLNASLTKRKLIEISSRIVEPTMFYYNIMLLDHAPSSSTWYNFDDWMNRMCFFSSQHVFFCLLVLLMLHTKHLLFVIPAFQYKLTRKISYKTLHVLSFPFHAWFWLKFLEIN